MSSTPNNALDVLITQAWGRIPYNVVRSLGRRGLAVAVGTDNFLGMAVLSRYASVRFRHPFVITETAEFVQSLKESLQRYSPKVYLPINEDLFVAARHLDELQKTGVVIPIARFETLRSLHKKDEVISLAKSLRIPIPETMVPKCENDIRHFSREVGPPIVMKRISSSGARGVFYVTEDQIIESWRRDLAEGRIPLADMVLQQRVDGVGYGVSMLFRHGTLRAHFTHRRLREKSITGGISTLRMSVTNPTLEDYAQRLLESVGFHGVAMVEFKYDERTGRTWLLEVNPRFWGSLALAIQSGVDFPYLLYRLAAEGDVPLVNGYRIGHVVRWIQGDLRATVSRWNRRRSLASSLSLRSHGYDDLYWDDPLPFFGSAALTLRKVAKTRNRSPDEIDLNIKYLEPAVSPL